MRLEDEIRQKSFKNQYQKLLINLVYTHNWVSYGQQQAFKRYGLTPPQFNVLRILRGQHPQPATINLLIERMLDKTSNASRIVDKLEAKGLVKRTTCSSDRRAVDVALTSEGATLLRKLDAVEEEWEQTLKNLTLEEAEQLNNLLDKLRGNTQTEK